MFRSSVVRWVGGAIAVGAVVVVLPFVAPRIRAMALVAVLSLGAGTAAAYVEWRARTR